MGYMLLSIRYAIRPARGRMKRQVSGIADVTCDC